MKIGAMFCLALFLGAPSAKAMPWPAIAFAGAVHGMPYLRVTPMLLPRFPLSRPLRPLLRQSRQRRQRQQIQMK